MCFAGPVGTADDLIARAVPCFANAIVITADAGLAKRCRSAARGRLQVTRSAIAARMQRDRSAHVQRACSAHAAHTLCTEVHTQCIRSAHAVSVAATSFLFHRLPRSHEQTRVRKPDDCAFAL